MKRPIPQMALLLGLLLSGFITRDVYGQTSPVTINFNNLPPGVVVTDQYQPYMTFSANGFSAGGGYPTDVFTNSDGSYPGSILSRYYINPGTTSTDVFMHFLTPVNNLSFKVLGVIHPYRACNIDVFVGGTYYNTYAVYGNSTPYYGSNPLTFNLGSLSNITHVHIYYVSNVYCDNVRCYSGFVYYDDITFTPDININIINSRVSGNLQGTTRHALLGGDVTLRTNVNRPGGTYLWRVTGPSGTYQRISSSFTQDTLIGRWTEAGTYTVSVDYTLNNIKVTSSFNINVVEPTLTSFSAIQRPEQIRAHAWCSGLNGRTWTLGCWPLEEAGIKFTVNASIPNLSYLSDPAQSGIKMVQAVSAYRKTLRQGNFMCLTKRSPEDSVESGWLADPTPPGPAYTDYVKFGNANNVINNVQLEDRDGPGTELLHDAYAVDDHFETYVYYFTGTEPDQPVYQRPMKLPGTSGIARIAWHWGGEAVFIFDPNPDGPWYSQTSSTTQPGGIPATATSAVKSMNTSVLSLTEKNCDGTAATTNMIDDTGTFVEQHYLDFLGRDPDAVGWRFWISNVTQCGFNATCTHNKRIDVSRAFFYSGEFIGSHPELGGQRGTHEYNHHFVYWCYRTYLQREPNAHPDNGWDGFNHWVGVLDSSNPDASDGKYNHIIDAFLSSIEYRHRFE